MTNIVYLLDEISWFKIERLEKSDTFFAAGYRWRILTQYKCCALADANLATDKQLIQFLAALGEMVQEGGDSH